MKKILISFAIILAISFVVATIWAWSAGKLFLRVPAKVILNSADSDKSAVYKSGKGDYFVILDRDEGEQSTYRQKAYWVGDGRVGVPDGVVPSMNTFSFQTRYFLVCLDATVDLVGTGWYAVDAKWSVSDEEINFQVNKDNVNIKF